MLFCRLKFELEVPIFLNILAYYCYTFTKKKLSRRATLQNNNLKNTYFVEHLTMTVSEYMVSSEYGNHGVQKKKDTHSIVSRKL